MPKCSWIWMDDRLVPMEETSLGGWGGALREGDGVFETVLARNGSPFLRELHLERLSGGLKILGIQNHFPTAEDFSTFIQNAVEKSGSTSFSRVRLQVSRREGAQLDSTESIPQILIDVIPLDSDPWPEAAPLRVGIHESQLLGFTALSSLKTCNRLPYVVAERDAHQAGWDDCLLRGPAGIAESTRSNLWWIQRERIFTPPLSSGCVDGTLRKMLLRRLPSLGVEVAEAPCEATDLQHADCIFLTNAIRGIQPLSDDGPLRGSPGDPILRMIQENATKWRNGGRISI